jgi:hypothetical protein
MFSLEEIDKRAFLFVGERCSDANTFGCIDDINRDFLRVLDGLEGAGASLGSI